MVSTRTHSVSTPDGSFDAHVAVPEAGSGPGMLVLQEIFGVNAYIRSVCERVAELGYVALAPDMFWRDEPGFTVEPDEADGMERAMAKMGGFDWVHAAADLGAAFASLQALEECQGGAGVMGFCFGGTLTFHAAADLDPAVAVSYYGSGVADALEAKADSVDCPILFHFGDNDPFLPNEHVDRIRAHLGDRPTVTIAVQPGAGHAFDNSSNPMFANPPAAEAAWQLTRAHLGRHLPVEPAV